MFVTINSVEYEIPFTPESISLSDFVAWHQEHGKDLAKELSEVIETKFSEDENINELEKEIKIGEYLDHEAIRWFSFWTKADLEEVKQHPGITPFLSQYRILRHLLKDDSFSFPYEVDWNGEAWAIQDFKINPASEMSFNEIITSKEIMRQVYAIGEDNWTGLPYLCAVFFRKKGEQFTDELIVDEGERMKSFKQLPLKHALAVAFFLNICVNIWSNLSQYLIKKEAAELSLN